MSWKNVKLFFRTLRFRLTFWYGMLFTFISGLAFLVIYLSLASMLQKSLEAELLSEAGEWGEMYRILGREGLQAEFNSEAQKEGRKRVFCRMLKPDLSVHISSDLSDWKRLPPPPEAFLRSGLPGGEHARLETLVLPGEDYPVLAMYCKDDEGYIYEFGHSLRDNIHILRAYRKILVTATLAMLLVGSAVGYLMAKRALRGLDRIAEAVGRFTEGDFSQRVSIAREGDEIEHLARAFNHMQDRIQSLISELREVTQNIAHDLRSPLTRIRGMAETSLIREPSLPAFLEALETVVEECDRMIALINTMLAIAEVESGIVNYRSGTADLREIVGGAVELFRAVAEEKRIVLETRLSTGPVRIEGDTAKLQRVVANLLDNAIKYTPEGGTVSAALGMENGAASVEIADTGVGIPEHEHTRIFDRFYRGDASRTSQGNGLGLSYVATMVKAHGGRVEVKSAPGKGTVFVLTFPHPEPGKDA